MVQARCPHCGSGAVFRGEDQYGAYDRCWLCGWLKGVGLHTDGLRADTRFAAPPTRGLCLPYIKARNRARRRAR